MNKEQITNVLNSMFDIIKQDQINLYKKLIDEQTIKEIKTHEEFYFNLIYPYEQFLEGLIRTDISNNDDVIFILLNFKFVERHFRHWIEEIEGSACCADKSRTIIKRLLEFYKTGQNIEFDYNAEYTYHLPKIIFKEHNDIIEFYKSVKNLFYGQPSSYMNELKNLIDIKQQFEQED